MNAQEAKELTDINNLKSYKESFEKDPEFNILSIDIDTKIENSIKDGLYSVSIKIPEKYSDLIENYYLINGYKVSESIVRSHTKISWRD